MRNSSALRSSGVSAQRACWRRILTSDAMSPVSAYSASSAAAAGLAVSRLSTSRFKHQLPGVDGRAPVAEAPAVEPRRARQQIGAARDVGGVAVEGQLLIDVDQLGEALEQRGQPLDLGERVGVAGLHGQHLAPGRQRRRARLQLVLLQIGDARQHRGRLAPLQRLALDLEHGDQARPGAARLVERLEDARDAQPLVGDAEQLLEQPPRALVPGHAAHDRLDQVERAVDVVEARRAQLGAAVGDVGDLGGRREAAARAEQLLEIAPALARGVVAFERAVGAQVGRVDPQHPLVATDGVVGIVEQRLVDLRHLRQQVEALGRLLDQVLARVDERAQIGPALALAEDPHQRLERALVQRLDGQDLGVDLLRVAGAAQALLVQLGDLREQVAAQRRLDARARRRRACARSGPASPASRRRSGSRDRGCCDPRDRPRTASAPSRRPAALFLSGPP